MNDATDGRLPTQRLSSGREEDVQSAAAMLRDGKLVAIPTETVYGLAANALEADAVGRIFTAKRRPGWDPLIVHICDQTMLSQVVRSAGPTAQALMEAFWPGPLTLLLPKHADLPAAVTAGRDLVGVRMPAHPVALRLIDLARLPLAAPSANLFGHISPTTAEHVLADLGGSIDAVLDAGPCTIGVESTVLDPDAMVLYRQGGVSAAAIERVTGLPVSVYVPSSATEQPESLPSPGVGMRHYAPGAQVVLVSNPDEMREFLAGANAEQTGVMRPTDWHVPWAGAVFAWGRWDNPVSLAANLYSGLRALDQGSILVIVCPLPNGGGDPLLEAVRDRLLKAARKA